MSETRVRDIHATNYDRSACANGIVHLGYGAFHRAHAAVYVDNYMQASGDLAWGIAAVNLRAAQSNEFAAAQGVENGYLLKTTTPDGVHELRKVRSHIAFEDWAQRREAAEALLSNPSVHCVTITVTESGYYLDEDGSLNPADPTIAGEMAGARPVSVCGFLAGALEQRAASIDAPINVLCCDNIRANGHMLERNFLAYLQLLGRAELAEWVRGKVSFPCSMVDRITPRTTDALRHEIAALFPGEDLNPIHGEAFIQWVLENRFAAPFPDLAQVGVEIVADVDPYEEAKIRILNGGHTGLTYMAALAGLHTFDEAMYDPRLRAHFDAFQEQEVLPALTIELPFDKADYLAKIADRFSNRAIADALERICMDGYAKMQIFVRPTLQGCLKQGIVPHHMMKSVASWYVFARRHAAGQTHINYVEPNWAVLEPLLAPGAEEQMARSTQLWSDLPERFDAFVPGLLGAIKEIEETWPV